MGSRHHDRAARGEEQLGQECGKRNQRDVALRGGQHLHMVAPAHVAHHYAVGGPVEVSGPEPFHHRDALLGQLGRHGRIHMLVGPAHIVASRAQQPGQGTHARARDANQVQFHRTSAVNSEESGAKGQEEQDRASISTAFAHLSTADFTGARIGDPGRQLRREGLDRQHELDTEVA